MKHYLLITTLLLALAPMAAAQFDFAAKSPSGHRLCYRILADSVSVELTHPEAEWPYYGTAKPEGRVVVPSEVSGRGRRYRVVAVGESAFYRCDAVSEVVMPATLLRIGPQAFCGCTSLRQVDLPDGLLSIGEGAFAYCKSLTSMSIPSSVAHVGISAFALCSGLSHLEVDEALWQRFNAYTLLGCLQVDEGKNPKKREGKRLFW